MTNGYTTLTGLSRAAETSVVRKYIAYLQVSFLINLQWNIDLNTGALSLQWTNSDGCKSELRPVDWNSEVDSCKKAAPSTAIFTQSGYIYAGGDQGSFTARYPSPVTALVSDPQLNVFLYVGVGRWLEFMQTLTFVQDTVAPV